MEFNIMHYIAQIIGAVALFFIVISYQQSSKKKLLLIQIISSILYFLQYLFLNAYTAVISSFISIVRTLLFYNFESKGKKIPLYFLILFEILILIIGIVTYKKLFTIIPIIILAIYSYAVWQENTKVTWIIAIITTVLWFIYNYIVGAYVAMVGSTIEFISAFVGLIRLRNKFELKTDVKPLKN